MIPVEFWNYMVVAGGILSGLGVAFIVFVAIYLMVMWLKR